MPPQSNPVEMNIVRLIPPAPPLSNIETPTIYCLLSRDCQVRSVLRSVAGRAGFVLVTINDVDLWSARGTPASVTK